MPFLEKTLPASGSVPGILACCAVTVCALALQYAQVRLFGYAWVDSLILAMVIGALYHTLFGLDQRLSDGMKFCSKTLLEIAIVLLGATIGFATLQSAGAGMMGIVALIVLTSISVSYCISRVLGLSTSLATLVACGNSICGNSAIMAIAPTIGAKAEDVASSIAFTSTLGIIVTMILPLGFHWFSLTEVQYGVVAGMTVYAVPQVLAATFSVSAISVQIGTIVKLMRVLMLGPVILMIGLRAGGMNCERMPIKRLMPWFLIGFLLMMVLNSLALIPDAWLPAIKQVSALLTIISMAALGLSVNIRTVLMSGGKVLAAGTLSLMTLAVMTMLILPLLPKM